jgi:GNAT superfamily N-acetyltransferase/SAM-dependent methyltransferase
MTRPAGSGTLTNMVTPTSLATRPVTVRTATSADGAAVRRVIAAANDQYAEVLPADVLRAYLADLLDDAMDDGQFEHLVAELDGEVVGSVRYYPDASVTGFGFPSDWAGFRALAVHPDRRGLGIGAALVGACIERARAAGATAIGIHTAAFMRPAVRIYERCGFDRVPAHDVDAAEILGLDAPDAPQVIAYRLGLSPAGHVPEEYPLGRDDAETRRLVLQHQLYAPLTREVFTAAGITRGMTVLDVGSGAGDVALLLTDMVGPQGRVVGVDVHADILEQARQRVAAAGWSNVAFTAGDVHTAELPADLDAVVGRWVLMYQADPAHTLRRLAARVRPGGVVAMIESLDLTVPVRTHPPTPTHEQIATWTARLDGVEGPIADMGLRLYRTFLDAGLPAPQLRLGAPIGGGPDWPGYAYMAASIRSLMPYLTRLGAVTAEEIGIDTLEERLRADVVAAGGVQLLPPVVGAWSSAPRADSNEPEPRKEPL